VAWIATLFFAVIACGAGGDRPPLEVEILSLLEPTRVEVRGPVRIAIDGGRAWEARDGITVARSGRGLVVSRPAGASTRAGSVRASSAAGDGVAITVRGRETIARSLAGPITIVPEPRALRIVAEIPLERLVASAVAAEVDASDAPAALEAASIAIRSYVVAIGRRHAAEGFDLCDTTHCLVSKGVPGDSVAARAAIAAAEATRGVVLEVNGAVVAGYYTACCGGETTTPEAAWGGAPSPAYARVVCGACRGSRFYRWTRSCAAGDLHAALQPLCGWRPRADAELRVEAGAGGWVRRVAITSDGRTATVEGEPFRFAIGRRLGWDALPSTRFTVERRGGRYVFRGGGFGHGIGLCLEGAVERARRGATRDAIVSAYYPRARLVSLP
jgi:stage II sporulation protein D